MYRTDSVCWNPLTRWLGPAACDGSTINGKTNNNPPKKIYVKMTSSVLNPFLQYVDNIKQITFSSSNFIRVLIFWFKRYFKEGLFCILFSFFFARLARYGHRTAIRLGTARQKQRTLKDPTFYSSIVLKQCMENLIACLF